MRARLQPPSVLAAIALLGGCSLAYDFDRAPPEGLGADARAGSSRDRGPGDGGDDQDADPTDAERADAERADAERADADRSELGPADARPPTDDGPALDLAPPGPDAQVGDGGEPAECPGEPRWVACGTSRAARKQESCGDNGRWVETVPCRVPPPDPCADRCLDCAPDPAPESAPTIDRGYQAAQPPDVVHGWDLRPTEIGAWTRLIFDGLYGEPAEGVPDSSRLRTYDANGSITAEACTGCTLPGGTTAVTYIYAPPGTLLEHPGTVVVRRDPGNPQQGVRPLVNHYLIDLDGRRVVEARNDVGQASQTRIAYRYDDPAVPDHPSEYVATDLDDNPIWREVRRYDPTTGARVASEGYAPGPGPGEWVLRHTYAHDSACWRCDADRCAPTALARGPHFVGFTARPVGITALTAINSTAAALLCSTLPGSRGEPDHVLLGETSAADLRRIGRRLRLTSPPENRDPRAWVNASFDVLEGHYRWGDTRAPVQDPDGTLPLNGGEFAAHCVVVDGGGHLRGVPCIEGSPLPAVCTAAD